jgi:tRNA G18 (ribose-2'-O)-methylase SpoU
VTRQILIDDPTDPRLSDYREVRERDLAGRDGFIAEGQVVLEKLIRGRHPLRSVLVAEKRLASLGGLLAELPQDVPVFAAGQSVMDTVVGFPIHRGILAVGERRPLDAKALLSGLPERALVVGLVGIANHDNMGGLFRNAAAFGAEAVLLDETCCDPLYRKAIRVWVAALFGAEGPGLPAALLDGVQSVRIPMARGFDSLNVATASGIVLHHLAASSSLAV